MLTDKQIEEIKNRMKQGGIAYALSSSNAHNDISILLADREEMVARVAELKSDIKEIVRQRDEYCSDKTLFVAANNNLLANQKELATRVKELEAQGKSMLLCGVDKCPQVGHVLCRDCFKELKALLAGALRALYSAQWNGRNTLYARRCPCCLELRRNGHTSECFVGNAIREIENAIKEGAE